ncbi:MAG TPA: hypothetical protein VJB66_03220 [Candidatus Nanoarchaeia archaeon]|nr:hypothetical protein [Candidatus Nanoarchaeia archaeon]
MKLVDYVTILQKISKVCGARKFGDAEFHDKWATFVREHPTEWKVYHNEFINAEIEMRQNFVECLAQQPGGKEKVREVYGITNPNAYPKLLG